jgi:hypothetical protein
VYLTEYREMTPTDVITKLEPDLFYKVTGLYDTRLTADEYKATFVNKAE